MKKLLALYLLVPFFTSAMEVEKKNLYVPQRLGNISVFKTEEGFEVEEADSTRVKVAPYRVNKELRRMNMRQLAKFTKAGYLSVNQSDDGQYSLDMHGRLRGGGPILASLFYWGTKAACYGSLVGGATAATAATGGTALSALVAGTGSTIATGTTAGAFIGGATATAVASSPTAVTVVGVVAGSTAATAGGLGMLVTGIEVAASFMGGLGLAIPFL